jgi:hypothetical protein
MCVCVCVCVCVYIYANLDPDAVDLGYNGLRL